MRITQKEIARDLNVSLITVSRALNDTGYVSREMKEKILTYAEEHNYIPHKASRALVRNKIRKIGFFSSTYPVYFWSDIRKGAAIAGTQIEGFNYRVDYHTIPDNDTQYYIRVLKEEIGKGLDGIALVNQRQYDMDRIFKIIETAGIPYITYNVDAPGSRRLCHVGSDYRAGGRLAAEFMGKMLMFKEKAKILIINLNEYDMKTPDAPDLNGERLEGFLRVMREQFPRISCEIALITTLYDAADHDTQISDLLAEKEGKVDGVYLIPAFNDIFLNAIDIYDYKKTVTVLHDLDQSAIHHLETDLLTGVIYQNPIFQGYYAVKTMENLLESSSSEKTEDIEIIHNVIMAENRDLISNHFVYTNMAE